MFRLILLPLLLSGCVAPPAAQDAPEVPRPALSDEARRERAIELECIRQGEIAERQQPWLGANNPRAAVIGARVRNSCLDYHHRGRTSDGRGLSPY
jgi:hypothetical protein